MAWSLKSLSVCGTVRTAYCEYVGQNTIILGGLHNISRIAYFHTNLNCRRVSGVITTNRSVTGTTRHKHKVISTTRMMAACNSSGFKALSRRGRRTAEWTKPSPLWAVREEAGNNPYHPTENPQVGRFQATSCNSEKIT